ncbi:flocculation protein FLO11-like isoform X2 [Xenia sp. Carnegie-2017]|uniref:flocculation protein FLO11-like isoform X2 n=1 Tax=Xenia sp. Carnegie-2017 TaxID=2897299 RepID=UPI001F048E4A|nr:flocculation protein FLO11-like isoform X2 [Xenia sp. Carnegie-2017]
MSIFLIFFFIISQFLYDLEGAPLNNKEISTKCYLCSEETGGCSSENNLQIEHCSLEDHFDKCIVIQAFSRTKNLTVIKRECASQRSCEQRESCADPDFSDCRFECCSGDLCNNFNFTDDKATVHTTSKAGLSIATETTKSNVKSAEEPSDVLSGPENTLNSAEGDPCTDLDRSCPVYVASSNLDMFCKDNFEFTKFACRKTCKFCLPAEEKVEKTTEKPTESLSTEESSKANELDRMTKKFDPTIRSDCRDIDPQCSAYAQSFCEINKQYSKLACEKTCGFCVLPGEKSTVPSTQKSTVTNDKSTVHTTSKAGLSIATERTKSNVKSAEEPSDVLSGPENTLIPAEGDPCTDLDPSCPVYVASSNLDTFCKENFEFTEFACRKTCKFCLPAEEKVEKTTEKPTESFSTEERSTPEPSTPEPSTPEPSTPKPSTPEPSTPEPSTPEPSTPEPKTTKKGNLAVNSELSSELSTTESSKANEVDRMTKKFDPTIRSDCRDIDPQCSAYAQSFCEINKQYSKLACEKTCGFCVLPGEKSTVPSTQKSTVTTKKSTVPSTSTATITSGKSTVFSTQTGISSDCEDLRSDCSEFKKMDYCRLFSLLSDSGCRKTCGLCDFIAGPTGVDFSPDTTTVESSEGTKLPPETTKLLNTAPTTSKSNITVTSSMSTKISTTEAITKLVTKSSLGPKINQKDCYDKRTKCATFAKYDGYCEYSRDFMSINCPKSCGFCDGKTTVPSESSQVMTPSKSTSEKISTSTTSESSRDTSTTDNQVQQGPDVSNPGNIRILTPANPETSPYGNNLRWKIWPWSECENGQQWRVVRCYHLFNEIDYHVTIRACIEHVSPMPLKYRNC